MIKQINLSRGSMVLECLLFDNLDIDSGYPLAGGGIWYFHTNGLAPAGRPRLLDFSRSVT